MTPSNGSITPPTQPADEELEARLAASWQHGVATAEDDLARTDLVAVALAEGRRRPPWRSAGGAILGVATLLLVGAAIIVGGGGRKEAVVPPASPAGPIASPAPVAGSPSPGPGESASPGDVVSIPELDPWGTFPPSVDGEQVVLVGPEADARIAAATDDAPILVGGWSLGSDTRAYSDFDLGSPAPNGVYFKDCVSIPLRATEDGGPVLRVHFSLQDPNRLPRLPSATQVMALVVQVHVHDAGCAAPDCAHKPVFERVVMAGSPRIAPPILATTMPPGGLSMEEAVAAARAHDASTKMGFGEPKVLLSAQAGPLAVVEDQASGSELDWFWVVRFASDDGHSTYAVYVNYLDGSVTRSFGSTVELP